MSWEPYVKSLTDGGFYQGCIAGHNGQIWGTTSSFKVLPVEVQTLVSVFSGKKDAIKRIKKRGFTIQGLPYTMNRLETTDDELAILIGRSKEYGAPARGVIVAYTAQTIIVGVHDPIYAGGMSFGKGHVAIYQLADALSGMNF